uniref:Uncharacterized protein n=1 Tax=Anas platyrhynchos platyrhynchos TaxID=8840 RepID=A0A493U0X8_ANAPP
GRARRRGWLRRREEARGLPPPPLVNKMSAWLGGAGWLAALLANGFSQRPLLTAGRGRGKGEGLG